MRFGSPWVGGSNGRAMVRQGSWDPLITNSQRPPHTTAHRPQPTGLKNNHSRPARTSAVADNVYNIQAVLYKFVVLLL